VNGGRAIGAPARGPGILIGGAVTVTSIDSASHGFVSLLAFVLRPAHSSAQSVIIKS